MTRTLAPQTAFSAQFEHTLLITDSGVEELTGKLPASCKQFWEKS